jgi:polyphosphate kinase
VVIELRARFDEMNNLRLADELRKAGVEVAFGFGRLKVHAKVALVARREKGVERLLHPPVHRQLQRRHRAGL